MFQQNPSNLFRKLVLNAIYLNPSRQLYQTHYEVLNLKRDCTTKEIRDSFIKLSKQYHPDLNKSKQSNIKFLKIKEAYNILSKPESRKSYDLGLGNSQNTSPKGTPYETVEVPSSPSTDPWKNPLFWSNRKHKFTNLRQEPYYGIKGVKKVSNRMIFMLCFVVMSVTTGLQALAINKSVTLKRDDMLRRSEEAGKSLEQTKGVALKNGNELQIEILKKRYEDNMKNFGQN